MNQDLSETTLVKTPKRRGGALLRSIFHMDVNAAHGTGRDRLPKQASERIEYLDALRGLTIILVVYSHVAVTVFKTACPSNDFFILFRMPLFFFVSGFLSFAHYDGRLMLRRTKNRVLMQLVPTLVMMSAYLLLFKMSFHWGFFNNMKRGYWFTFVVVEYFFLYMALVGIFKLTKAGRLWQTLTLLALMVTSYCCWRWLPEAWMKNKWCQLFSVSTMLYYLPFFFTGLLCKMHWRGFCRLIENGWFMSAMVALFIAFYYTDLWQTGVVLRRIVGVFLVFRIFQYYSHVFSSATRIGRVLSHLGKYTLEIYLLHYFFIRSLRSLPRAFDWSPMLSSWILQLAVYLTLALAITSLCLLIAKAIRIAPPLYRLCFGRLK